VRIEEEITYKYVTEDGQVYLSRQDAVDHENFILRLKLNKTVVKVDKYEIYTINNQQELNALIFENSYGERTTTFPKEGHNFPIHVCETHDDGYYYFEYILLSELIEKTSELLIQLEEIKK
jgi:hypothetical protein